MSDMYGTATGDSTGEQTINTGADQSSTRDVASQEARGVADDAKAAGQQTLGTAKAEAGAVADEVKQQASQIFDQARQEFGSQAATQHERAASGLRALADELSSLAQGSDQSGVVSDVARQAGDRTREAADWLESRSPGDVLDELKSLARRRPGAFLAGAAILGVVGGRLTRGITDQVREEKADEVSQPPVDLTPVSTDDWTDPAVGMPTMPAPAADTGFATTVQSPAVTTVDPLSDPLTDAIDAPRSPDGGRL